ncbi:GNAT family N-acetyltransferase [Pedobacter sp. Leaf194]|uniref:GNAT family N-acetyltransferase n=1 Tax=Pedobacter sp. Leaf194 TaxID=1736297 RepID=UPI0007036E6D|nr:N-acetyltransferase [Pedobacter sp. Leaf194]KQS34410.1 hypothetical protein ASG14_14895 [Pedobacter sp. Leaf194]
MLRRATPEDAKAIAPLIIQAMGKLANKFSRTSNSTETLALFEQVIAGRNNQYSYENILVFEENGEILGSLNAYDGGRLGELRKNFVAYLQANSDDQSLPTEAETEPGEFYLDTISVAPAAQGKGIGKQLIDGGIKWASELGIDKAGLLVEVGNKKALELYQKKEFKVQNKKEFLGELFYHMIYQISRR